MIRINASVDSERMTETKYLLVIKENVNHSVVYEQTYEDRPGTFEVGMKLVESSIGKPRRVYAEIVEIQEPTSYAYEVYNEIEKLEKSGSEYLLKVE